MPRRRSKPRAAPSGPSGLVKDLIDQFDEPRTFYRELIQNSIDAGSNRIDVTLDYVPGRPGRAVIRVEDDGEGMDEKIIDDYLLVLFASSKENDFTKIGKFGIGFVSVFAPRPEIVRVHTAKNGESWRLDFPSPKRYEKYRVSRMREGTLVELEKAMGPREYEKLVAGSLETIRYWCKHSESRILFRDKRSRREAEAVNLPFDLGPSQALRYQEEGTEVVLGFSADEEPFYGFYNRGLTLKEGRKAFFPGVCLKVKSRYLEHTLTRDNVLEDANYASAMRILERLVDEKLPGALREQLEKGGSGPQARRLWEDRLPFLRRLAGRRFPSAGCEGWPIVPLASGRAATLAELSASAGRAGGKLYFEEERTALTDALERRAVLVARPGPWLDLVQTMTKGAPARASAAFLCPEPVRSPDDGTRRFFAALDSLDAGCGRRFAGVLPAGFAAPPGVAAPFALAQREPGTPVELGRRERPGFFGAARYALVNVEHPSYRALARLFPRRPALAAFLTLKLLWLHDGRVEPKDAGSAFSLNESTELALLGRALALDGEAA